MEFRILGPLEAIDGTEPLALGGHRQRALLARLLLEVNRTVSVQRLIDDLWGEEPPASATKMVQIFVSHLRKVLPPDVLCTRGAGYAVEADAEAVDVVRFTRLRDGGRAALANGDAAAAAEQLVAALGLWRGPPLAEFDEPFARVEAAHLEELRLACLEERIQADLALGRHADAAAELEALVAQHPLREALHGQLMLALYRAGRQAEALAAYERFRRTLDDELGIEPTAALRGLQHQILNQDDALELPARAGGPAAPSRDAAPPWSPGFVGRTAELRALGAALEAALEGRGGPVLVPGSAGIGKSRLVGQLAALARTSGATVLTGRCIQLIGTGLPYLPLVDALQSLPAASGPAELRELPRLVPGLAAPGAAPPDGDVRPSSRLRLFQEVLAVAGEHEPLVLVLEDLHWADESTLDLVAFLAHAVDGRRILFVATYRDDEVRSGDHLQQVVAALAGAVTTLPVAPLPPDQVRTLLDPALPAELAAAIVDRAEGNPFFATELAAAAARGDTALPPALRDVLLAKVAYLDEHARAVLRVAAAAGRDVPYALLAAVIPGDELGLAEALRAAVDGGVLEPDHATGSFRFRHALFAEAIYGTLLPGERELLHERLARAITEEPKLAASGAAAAEPAHHWAAAGRPVEALVASLQAAREAEAVSGLREALRHVERVLELWDAVPEAERLAGFALPTVLEWATELAGDAGAARDPEPAGLGIVEARRLYPSAIVLESLAVRVSPPFDAAALDALRRANGRFRAAMHDPVAASEADDEFHRALTAGCPNEHLLAALRPVKRALLRYEWVFMEEPARIERSAAHHEAIIAALERGDRAGAAQLLRENLAYGLPDLTDALERR